MDTSKLRPALITTPVSSAVEEEVKRRRILIFAVVAFLAIVMVSLSLFFLSGNSSNSAGQQSAPQAVDDISIFTSLTLKFNFDRAQDRSAPFYAVILKSAEICSIPEEERLKAQALFPRQKVFLQRYFCQEFSDNVTYTNVDGKFGFIAVYAGETESEARKILAQVKATGQFPTANIRRMQVIFVYQLE